MDHLTNRQAESRPVIYQKSLGDTHAKSKRKKWMRKGHNCQSTTSYPIACERKTREAKGFPIKQLLRVSAGCGTFITACKAKNPLKEDGGGPTDWGGKCARSCGEWHNKLQNKEGECPPDSLKRGGLKGDVMVSWCHPSEEKLFEMAAPEKKRLG